MVCLSQVPATRNSDIALMIEIINRFFPQRVIHGKNGDGIYLRDLYDLPREDNIKRLRAHIQNVQGLHLPTEWKIAKKRKIKEEIWKKYMLDLSSFKRI